MLRGRSHDLETVQGRSRERYRRALLTSFASVSLRATSLLTGFVSVPIAIHYLGTETYGLWQTIAAIAAFLTFADFGLGNSVMNAISKSTATNDRRRAMTSASSGFFLLLAIAMFICAVFAMLYPSIRWPEVLNVHSSVAKSEAGPATAAFVVCTAFAIPLTIVQRIQFGYQEGFMSSLWTGLGSIGGLAGLIVATKLNLGLEGVILSMTGVPLIALALNWIQEFGLSRRWLLPRLSHFRFETAKDLLSSGSLFLVLQAMTIVTFSSDAVVANRALGPAAVAQFSVVQRLFLLAPTLLGLAAMPLWPALTEAYVRGDLRWVRQASAGMLLATGIGSIAASAMVLWMAPAFIAWWVGPSLVPSQSLSLALAGWSVAYVIVTALGLVLNATRGLGFEAIMLSATALASVILKVALAPTAGLAGMALGGIAAYLFIFIVPCSTYIVRRLYVQSA